MNWLKKIFTPKASDISDDAMTYRELGDYLFNLCVRQVSSFLDYLEHWQKMTPSEFKVDRKSINQVELLIAFMWLYFDFFDLLRDKKYEKPLTRMHTCFMNHMTNLGLESEIWHLLQMRYDEYLQRHRSHGEIDFTYKKVGLIVEVIEKWSARLCARARLLKNRSPSSTALSWRVILLHRAPLLPSYPS